MIGVVFATDREARPFLERGDCTPLAQEPVRLLRLDLPNHADGLIVAVCGIGYDNAAAAVDHLIRNCRVSRVVNAGLCGGLREGYSVGDVLRVTDVCDGDAILAGRRPVSIPCLTDVDAWDALAGARLASVREPVFESDRKLKLAQCADIVEMEGLAVAEACQRGRVAFGLVKGVSDRADADGKRDIQANIDRVSELVADRLVLTFRHSSLSEPTSARPSAGMSAPAATSATSDPSLLSRLLSFTKIEHTAFSLPFLFAGAWLGWRGSLLSARVLLLILAAGVGARLVGMSMNRVLDRRLDALNPRTRSRELPAGRLSLGHAVAVAGAGLALYVVSCMLLGEWCLRLAPVVLVPLVTYPLLKRFTALCHFGVGLCLTLAPVGAFVAASGGISFGPRILWLMLLTFTWLSGSDIIYALLDRDSDLRTGVHSIPASLGERGALCVSAGLHLVTLIAVVQLLLMSAGRPAGWCAAAVSAVGLVLMYVPCIPVATRFFPVSAIVGVAAALVPVLGGMP